MAGSSMTFTYEDIPDGSGRLTGIQRLVCDFVTDSGTGAATGDTRRIAGEIVKIVTDPGSPAPSANWDVVVTDENGLSPFAKCENAARLIARHTTSTEEDYLFLVNTDTGPLGIATYPIVAGVLTVAVANAGNSTVGRIVFYYRV